MLNLEQLKLRLFTSFFGGAKFEFLWLFVRNFFCSHQLAAAWVYSFLPWEQNIKKTAGFKFKVLLLFQIEISRVNQRIQVGGHSFVDANVIKF